MPTPARPSTSPAGSPWPPADAAAFTATGGGTVTATQNNTTIVNTIITDAGTALHVANTDIGAAGLTFRSISAGNNGSTPGVGIVLDNTGVAVSNGGLTVTGTGTAASGGRIWKKTGADGRRPRASAST